MNREQVENLEIKISLFLRYGVLIAGVLMLIGWLGQIDLGDQPFLRFADYQESSLAHSLNRAFQESETTTLIAYLGLFCLISLPIIRVLLTLILFLVERQWIMSALAALVFSALLFSFALGIHV